MHKAKISVIFLFITVTSLSLTGHKVIKELSIQDQDQGLPLGNNIVDAFLGQQYIGQYNSGQFTSLFSYLDVSEGSMQLDFLNDPQYKNTTDKVNTVAMELYNPVYHDKKAVVLLIPLPQYSTDTNSWISESTTVQVYKLNKEQAKSMNKCQNTSFTISLLSSAGFTPKNAMVNVQMLGNGASGDVCNFKFESTLHYHDYKLSAVLYCIFVSVIVFMQIVSAYKLINLFSNNQIEASKLSLTTIAFCNIQDFFLTMMHLYFLMAEDQYYVYFILPIFLLVLLSVVFDMKLLFIVWREKYKNQINSPMQLRKKLTMFYVKFYLGLFSYLTIMYFFPYQIWSILLQAFFILPQIIHNSVKGNNPKFYPFYIFGVLGLRMILPLYYRGCPSNIYVIQPSKIFCVLWVLFFSIQIIMLFLQYKLGPRFFVPKAWIPGYYDYTFKYRIPENQECLECPICLEVLTAGAESEQNINNSMLVKEAIVMKAPCDHMFHPECLKNWIDVKLECPTCRGVLPALNL